MKNNNAFFHKKVLTPFLVIVLSLVCIIGTTGIFSLIEGAEVNIAYTETISDYIKERR